MSELNEKLLSQVFKDELEKKFEDGKVQELISKSIDKCLDDIISNLFTRYDSELKKKLEEKIKPVISNVIANTSMEGYVEKLTILTEKFINNREISGLVDSNREYNFNSVLGLTKKYSSKDTVKLSTIFSMYREWLNTQLNTLSYNTDDFNWDDGVEYVNWEIGLEHIVEDNDREHCYFRHSADDTYRLYARPEEDSLLEYEDYNFDIYFSICKSYNGEKHINVLGDITLSELCRLPSFLITMYNLSSSYVKIEEDKQNISEEIDIELRWEDFN